MSDPTKNAPPSLAAERQVGTNADGEPNTTSTPDDSRGGPNGRCEPAAVDQQAWHLGRHRGSSQARLVSARAKADRIALQREQREADERAMAPLMREIDQLEAAAHERGDNESVSRCAMARFALRRGAYLRADELLQKVREAAKPKPTLDQRELLISVMAKHLGVDACQEALRRAREHARRVRGRA